MLLHSACPDVLIWSPASPPCQPSGWTYRHLWTRTPRWPGCVLFHLNYRNMNGWVHSEVCVHCCFCSEPPTECENGTTDDLSPPPVVNGTTTPQTEENGSNGLSGKTRHAKCGCPTYGQWKLMPFNFFKHKKRCRKNFAKLTPPPPFKIVPQPPSITPAPTEQQDVNGLETLSTSNTGPSMSDQPVGTTSSPLDSTNLLCDAAGEEQQNENNNHPRKAF